MGVVPTIMVVGMPVTVLVGAPMVCVAIAVRIIAVVAVGVTKSIVVGVAISIAVGTLISVVPVVPFVVAFYMSLPGFVFGSDHRRNLVWRIFVGFFKDKVEILVKGELVNINIFP